MTPLSVGAAKRCGATPGSYPRSRNLRLRRLQSGNLAEAAQALEKAVALRQDDGNALADLGNVYLRQDRVDDAQNVLQRALALDPTLPLANNMMGLANVRKGDGVAAETHFTRSHPRAA